MKTMNVTVTTSGTNVTVHCPDTLVEKGSGTVTLKWVMATDGWEITGLSGLDNADFTDKQKDGKGYKCKDKNNTVGSYPYTISVAPTGTGAEVLLDPTITNGGPDLAP